MQKEKQIKSYQRKTKSGKVVTVKAHTAKYTAADMAAEALRKKHGAGNELEGLKRKSPGNKEKPSERQAKELLHSSSGKVYKRDSSGELVEANPSKTSKKKETKKPKPRSNAKSKNRTIGTGVNGPVKKSPKTKDVLPIPEAKTKKRMSPKSTKRTGHAGKSIPFSGQTQLKQEMAMWKKSPTSAMGKASRNNITKLLQEKKKQGHKLTKREEAFLW